MYDLPLNVYELAMLISHGILKIRCITYFISGIISKWHLRPALVLMSLFLWYKTPLEKFKYHLAKFQFQKVKITLLTDFWYTYSRTNNDKCIHTSLNFTQLTLIWLLVRYYWSDCRISCHLCITDTKGSTLLVWTIDIPRYIQDTA